MFDFVTTSSYVDPTGFPHGGNFFVFQVRGALSCVETYKFLRTFST